VLPTITHPAHSIDTEVDENKGNNPSNGLWLTLAHWYVCVRREGFQLVNKENLSCAVFLR